MVFYFFITQQVCVTPDCVDVSAYIMKKMNSSADPCVDFYSYSCGGWERTTFIPPERAKYDTFAEVQTNNDVILKRVRSAAKLTVFTACPYFWMSGKVVRFWRAFSRSGKKKWENEQDQLYSGFVHTFEILETLSNSEELFPGLEKVGTWAKATLFRACTCFWKCGNVKF